MQGAEALLGVFALGGRGGGRSRALPRSAVAAAYLSQACGEERAPTSEPRAVRPCHCLQVMVKPWLAALLLPPLLLLAAAADQAGPLPGSGGDSNMPPEYGDPALILSGLLSAYAVRAGADSEGMRGRLSALSEVAAAAAENYSAVSGGDDYTPPRGAGDHQKYVDLGQVPGRPPVVDSALLPQG